MAAAFNHVLSPDAVPSEGTLSSRHWWCRYFPSERLVIAAEELPEALDDETTAHRITERALLSLSDAARRDCRAAVIGWINAEGIATGAALELGPLDQRSIVACSWLPRHLWPHQAPDPDHTPQKALDEAIALVKQFATKASFVQREDVEGAIRFCGVCCKYAKGVAPAPAGALPPDRDRWAAWLADFIDAAEAERLRLFPHTTALETLEQRASGILDGVRVFVSYAMPTNVQVARPLKRVLESHGAVVWFDQTERPEENELASGLREIIEAQDIFLLCASRELFENAGYALQELAWVLNLKRDRSWSGAVCIAELDDVAVPRAFENVPRVALSRLNVDRWPEIIVSLVLQARNEGTRLLTDTTVAPDQTIGPRPMLELDDLRLRARHASAWWHLDETALLHALRTDILHATRSAEYQALRETIRRLKWEGTLATYGSWPADPAIRDVRVRLGTLSTLFLICALDLEGNHTILDLEADMAFLAEQPLPLIAEPAVAGWDDEERRFAVRHHLGALSHIDEVIRRGLATALVLHTTPPRRDRWESAIRERRLDCVDCLLELRTRERVAWDKRRSVHWDGAYHALDGFLYGGVDQWSPVPPDWVRLAVAGERSDLSAVFADVAWRASRSGARAERVFEATTIWGQMPFHVVAAVGEVMPLSIAHGSGRAIVLAGSIDENGAGLVLKWHEGASCGGAARATKILRL
ncbi:MAG: toll/interleukin-1 receptor domain-containing protein [Nitrospira sp.]|nr:toll/interleukin-1 receptor domain-containing protein [Nitrospira sp.]